MVWRSLVVACMTGMAVLGQTGKGAARVTLVAVQSTMSAGEGEGMIEVCWAPGRDRMTLRAVL